jgi:hypothetical protein
MEMVLRRIFASDIIDKRYRYSEKEEDTKIRIFRAFPKRLEFPLSIAISAGGFTGRLSALGQQHDLVGQRANPDPANPQPILNASGGHTIMPIELKVYAKGSSDDRENVTDILTMIFQIWAERGQFKKFGWVDWRVTGEGQYMDVDKELVFTNSVTINAQTDYTYVIKPEQAVLIEKIALEVIPVVNL